MVPISARGRFPISKASQRFSADGGYLSSIRTVILRPAAALADLAHLAEERKQTAPEIEKSRCCQRFKQRSSTAT